MGEREFDTKYPSCHRFYSTVGVPVIKRLGRDGSAVEKRPSRSTTCLNAPGGATSRGHIVKFMLMMHAPRGTGNWDMPGFSPEDLKAHIDFMHQLNRDLVAAGEFVGAEGLAPPGQARIVRATAAGTPSVTDGPFAETKEFLAGYWIVQVKHAERAYDIAARVSAAPGPRGAPLNIPVEVREVGSAPE
jgi:hypothetical protein